MFRDTRQALKRAREGGLGKSGQLPTVKTVTSDEDFEEADLSHDRGDGREYTEQDIQELEHGQRRKKDVDEHSAKTARYAKPATVSDSSFFEWNLRRCRPLHGGRLSREKRQMFLAGAWDCTNYMAVVSRLRAAWEDHDLRDKIAPQSRGSAGELSASRGE